MPLRATCSSCDKSYTLSDALAGKSVRCKGCGEIFQVAAAKPVTPSTPARRPNPASREAIRGESPKVVRRRVVEEDEDEDQPRKKKKKKRKKKSADRTPMIVGASVAGGILVVMVITFVVVASRRTAVEPIAVAEKPVARKLDPVAANPAPVPKPPVVRERPVAQPEVPAPAPKAKPAPVVAPPVAEPAPAKTEGPLEIGGVPIAIVESKYLLPPSSEVRWLEKRREELELNRKTMRLAYDKVGKRDPKWDESAREALELMTRNFTNQIKPVTSHYDVFAVAKKAIDAGCDDPMVLYVYARTSVGKYAPELAEYNRRIFAAAEALRKSEYSRLRRSTALLSAAVRCTNPKLSQADRAKAVPYAEEALADYIDALKHERNLFTKQAFRHGAAQLVGLFERIIRDSQAAFDHVDRAIAAIPEAKAIRLGFRADIQIDLAWEARGSGVADTVTQEGFRKLRQFATQARDSLNEAWKLDPTDPWIAHQMLVVRKALGGEPEQFEADVKLWFDRAMNLDPDNYHACELMLDILDPRWYGSDAELVAFGRECLKSANVCNRIATLIADAHLRVAIRREDNVRVHYLQRRDVRKEIDGALQAYFKAVPDNQYECTHAAMHLYHANDVVQAGEWFKRAEVFAQPTFVFSSNDIDKARNIVTEQLNRRGLISVPFKRWEKLQPPVADADKDDERLLAEWVLGQGGVLSYDREGARGKTQRSITTIEELPTDGEIRTAAIRLKNRKTPIEMPSMAGCKNLSTIQFDRVDLRLSEVQRFGTLPKVWQVSLRGSSTIDDALLAELLRHCTGISQLFLDDTAVTEVGLRELESRKLFALSLAGTKLTDASLVALAKLKVLGDLDLRRTEISAAGIERLRREMTKTKILFGEDSKRLGPPY